MLIEFAIHLSLSLHEITLFSFDELDFVIFIPSCVDLAIHIQDTK